LRRRRAVRRFLGIVLPGLLNAGLALWIVWHLIAVPGYARSIGFGAFVWLYAVGGLAIVLSCASAFMLLAMETSDPVDAARRRLWLMLALVNTTIPSVLMLLLVVLR
jgi:energy-converting hydrogenase Eha subunit B